jgi:hypothetical protein
LKKVLTLLQFEKIFSLYSRNNFCKIYCRSPVVKSQGVIGKNF